ncbi:MAG: nitrate reductase cytochrome c-type subunit [Rhodocyclaceae bacterium]|jgi:cytochrome c-type protein NapB|nr:nitrate reductase cytochrome c-type subunit [Rhodocyclaceae bacterium]
MKRTVTMAMALTAALLFGCTQQFAGVKSMRGDDVATGDKVATPKSYVGKKPGLQEKVARTFSTQPPVIPHAVENFDDVNLEENQCMSCHSAATFEKKKAPKIGDSHFIDPRTGKKLADSSMARYNCTQCHVPQVDAPPLVENTFVGNVKN